MKALHTILTILLVISVLNGLIVFFQMAPHIPDGQAYMHIGSFIGAFAFPGVIWVARYFVGKKLKQSNEAAQ